MFDPKNPETWHPYFTNPTYDNYLDWHDQVRSGNLAKTIAAEQSRIDKVCLDLEKTALNKNAAIARWVSKEKLPYHLLPSDAVEEILKVLNHGRDKHGDRAWETGSNYSKHFAALMRHAWKWWRKTDGGIDPESGLSHLAHAGARLLFLLAYEARKIGKDDR